MYHVLSEEQIARLRLCKSEKARERIRKFLAYLVKEQRIWMSDDGKYYCSSPNAMREMDRGLFAAVWVLTEFIDQAEFHSAGDYPAKIIFLAGEKVYEIVHAAQGKEVLLAHVLAADKEPPHYLVLVDDPTQIEELQIPHTAGYCTVSPDGQVTFFQKEQEVED